MVKVLSLYNFEVVILCLDEFLFGSEIVALSLTCSCNGLVRCFIGVADQRLSQVIV